MIAPGEDCRFVQEGESTPVRARRMSVVRRMTGTAPRSPARRSARGRGLMDSFMQGVDDVADTLFG